MTPTCLVIPVSQYILKTCYFIFRREPTLALSEYPVKNWSFWNKLSEVYDNLDIIKKQRSFYGLSFPEPRKSPYKVRTDSRNSRPARLISTSANQAYYMTRQT